MEARNLVAARECVEDGHWIQVTLNGQPRIRKPPLPTWLAALSMKLSGTTASLLVGRLPNLLPLVLAVVFTVLAGRPWLGPSASWLAALLAATTLLMQDVGRRAMWDFFTFSFALGGAVFLDRALRSPALSWGPLLASALLWGLSFLSKGPVTLFSVFAPYGLAILLTGQARVWRWRRLPLVLCPALVLGFSWWGYLLLINPDTWHSLLTEIDNWTSYHVQPWYYYLTRFPPQLLPWLPSLVVAILVAFRRPSPAPAEDGSPALRHGLRFFLVWLGLGVLFLSLLPEKKFRYAYPVVWPAALAMVAGWQCLLRVSFASWPRSWRTCWLVQFLPLPLAALASIPTLAYFLSATRAPLWILWTLPSVLLAGGMAWRCRNLPLRALWWGTLLVMLLTMTAMLILPATPLNHSEERDLETCGRLESFLLPRPFFTYGPDEVFSWLFPRSHGILETDTVPDAYPALVLVPQRRLELFRAWEKRFPELRVRWLYRFHFDQDNYRLLFVVDKAPAPLLLPPSDSG